MHLFSLQELGALEAAHLAPASAFGYEATSASRSKANALEAAHLAPASTSASASASGYDAASASRQKCRLRLRSPGSNVPCSKCAHCRPISVCLWPRS